MRSVLGSRIVIWMLPIALAVSGILLLVVSLYVAIALTVSPGVLENLIEYFSAKAFWNGKSFQLLKRHKAIPGIALQNQALCYSSLFFTKATKNMSGVMRKSALNCCFMTRSFSIVSHVLKTYFFSINGLKSPFSIQIHGL